MAAMLRPLIKIAMVAGLALATAGPHAVAQSDNPVLRQVAPPGSKNPLSWLFGGEPRKVSAPRRSYQPKRRAVEAYRPATAAPSRTATVPAQPGAPTDGSVPQVADVAPAVPTAPVQIAVIGDSLAANLISGFGDVYADRPYVTIQRRSRDSSGLVRDDYYDWPKALKEILAAPERLDAILIMVGSNDRQHLRDDTGAHEPRSERWLELYAQRIDAMIAMVREKGVPLIWVGLPVMRSERYSADMLAFNEIYRARAHRAGIPYIDVWEAFTNEEGEYSMTGPDVSGEVVRLRASDGVHFTRAGARKLAYFADKAIQPIVAAAQAKVAVAMAPPSIPGIIQPPAGYGVMLPSLPEGPTGVPPQLRSIDSSLGVARPDAPLLTDLKPRPLAGPVQPLTGAVIATGAQLAAGKEAPRSDDVRRLFVEGAAVSPKPGRADDFRL